LYAALLIVSDTIELLQAGKEVENAGADVKEGLHGGRKLLQHALLQATNARALVPWMNPVSLLITLLKKCFQRDYPCSF